MVIWRKVRVLVQSLARQLGEGGDPIMGLRTHWRKKIKTQAWETHKELVGSKTSYGKDKTKQ